MFNSFLVPVHHHIKALPWWVILPWFTETRLPLTSLSEDSAEESTCSAPTLGRYSLQMQKPSHTTLTLS